jgi:hypothetical protein
MSHNTRKGGANAAINDDGHAVNALTFEQQQDLVRLQMEAERRAHAATEAARAAVEAEERRALADERQMRIIQAQLDLARAQAAAQPVNNVQHAFRVTDAIRLVPPFDERNIDLYLSNFEKIATAQNWPVEHWSAVLTPLLKGGKVLRAMNRLQPNEISDYDTLKGAVLDEFELVPEAYRSRFRTCVKRQTDSYCDFNNFMCIQFDRWLNSVAATNDIDVLKNVLLMEQFISKVPEDIRQYLLDKKCSTSNECAKRADEYVTMHKTARKDVSRPGHNNSNNGNSDKRNGQNNYSQNNSTNIGLKGSNNNNNNNSDHKSFVTYATSLII